MAHTEKKRRTARVPISDAELIGRLGENVPRVLRVSIPEAAFDAAIDGLLKRSPTGEAPHFYCRKCGEYHLKSRSHYRSQR